MFKIQKSGNKRSSGEVGLNIRTHVSPKVGHDQVIGVRKIVKLGNKVEISKRVKNLCNVLSMEGVTVYGHHPECRVTFGRGGPHIVQ